MGKVKIPRIQPFSTTTAPPDSLSVDVPVGAFGETYSGAVSSVRQAMSNISSDLSRDASQLAAEENYNEKVSERADLLQRQGNFTDNLYKSRQEAMSSRGLSTDGINDWYSDQIETELESTLDGLDMSKPDNQVFAAKLENVAKGHAREVDSYRKSEMYKGTSEQLEYNIDVSKRSVITAWADDTALERASIEFDANVEAYIQHTKMSDVQAKEYSDKMSAQVALGMSKTMGESGDITSARDVIMANKELLSDKEQAVALRYVDNLETAQYTNIGISSIRSTSADVQTQTDMNAMRKRSSEWIKTSVPENKQKAVRKSMNEELDLIQEDLDLQTQDTLDTFTEGIADKTPVERKRAEEKVSVQYPELAPDFKNIVKSFETVTSPEDAAIVMKTLSSAINPNKALAEIKEKIRDGELGDDILRSAIKMTDKRANKIKKDSLYSMMDRITALRVGLGNADSRTFGTLSTQLNKTFTEMMMDTNVSTQEFDKAVNRYVEPIEQLGLIKSAQAALSAEAVKERQTFKLSEVDGIEFSGDKDEPILNLDQTDIEAVERIKADPEAIKNISTILKLR